jgi:hypothetical protein
MNPTNLNKFESGQRISSHKKSITHGINNTTSPRHQQPPSARHHQTENDADPKTTTLNPYKRRRESPPSHEESHGLTETTLNQSCTADHQYLAGMNTQEPEQNIEPSQHDHKDDDNYGGEILIRNDQKPYEPEPSSKQPQIHRHSGDEPTVI